MRTPSKWYVGTEVVSGPVGADFFMRQGWEEGGDREMYGEIRGEEKHMAEREQRPEVRDKAG